MLVQKDRSKFYALIFLCVLMIVSMIASITNQQLLYTFNVRYSEGDLNHIDLANQVLYACQFTSSTTFNLAHWLFAFSYFVLSYRIELITKDLPEDTYKSRLMKVNILVCLYTVVIPAIVWIYAIKDEVKIAEIAFDVELFSLVLSCIVLVWGIYRLVKLSVSFRDLMVNKTMILMHIVAYLAIVVVSALQFFFPEKECSHTRSQQFVTLLSILFAI
jgi:hypothetical protein